MSTRFGAGFTTVNTDWATYKIYQVTKNLNTQYEENEEIYTIYGYDGPNIYICYIWKDKIPSSEIESYTQEQNDIDKSEFETKYKLSANKPLSIRTSDGRARQVIEKSETGSTTLYSFDWADKTTWYEKSSLITNEVAGDSGDHLTYALSHTFIIDTYHGLFTNEDFVKDATGNSFRVTVKVNDVAKTEQDPHIGSGGDYLINYKDGKIIFLSALDPSDTVKVTYHYAGSSVFTIKPLPGKKLVIDVSEVQFSEDVEILDTVIFQAYGLADVFAPQLPSGTLIPLGNPVKYKSISDYQNDALKAYPSYPPLGGSGWRGMPQGVYVFDWDYLRGKVLSSAAGMEIRISLEHDIPFEGFYATATFYCAVENE
jgi:hypothetical protein